MKLKIFLTTVCLIISFIASLCMAYFFENRHWYGLVIVLWSFVLTLAPIFFLPLIWEKK